MVYILCAPWRGTGSRIVFWMAESFSAIFIRSIVLPEYNADSTLSSGRVSLYFPVLKNFDCDREFL